MPDWLTKHPKQIPGSNREHVLSGMRLGQSNKQIADKLKITPQRVGQIRDIVIREKLLEGEHYLDLMHKYNITARTMNRIRKGAGYTQIRWEKAARKYNREQAKKQKDE